MKSIVRGRKTRANELNELLRDPGMEIVMSTIGGTIGKKVKLDTNTRAIPCVEEWL
ncbi:hypothetical protein N781_16780 [Pontibacillus halophilus JSM 076056 = DSM 19796]|uniref:Uncharacterized protein n=1 Tax=Pontibacillus halophilus JSM 076056 = DSM 19796 TaxID=1385510 RepID=A0A0A5GKN4_9BACI|nr:hypothetical protein N781_16780 [Pontibacillus halophilus JSM 076056 = DSM 19796]